MTSAVGFSTGISTSENVSIFCGLPFSNTSKSSRVEPGHELALLVGDDDVHVDVVHLDLERDAGCLP